MTASDDHAAAGGDRLRAGHADREQVIEALKTAFVDGRLTRDELDARAGRALAARTYADLAALTADIPSGSAASGPARPCAPARRRPLARAAAMSGGCLVIAAALVVVAFLGPPVFGWCLLLGAVAVVVALGILGDGLVTAADQRRSHGPLPSRPGSGGHALDAGLRGGTGHDPAPPSPRPDQARADLRAHKSPQHRQRVAARARGAARGVGPVPVPPRLSRLGFTS
jgi:Domain of unknown function (DUF1707)